MEISMQQKQENIVSEKSDTERDTKKTILHEHEHEHERN